MHVVSLRTYNSFRVEAFAESLISVRLPEQLPSQIPATPFKILGGGTNILLTKNVEQPILHIEIKGIELTDERVDEVIVRIGAGELWTEAVDWAVDREFGGIENLSLIPGTAGAAPVQNIGAYGVELKDVLHAVEAFDFIEQSWNIIGPEECQFGYRDSRFKREWKDRRIITAIQLKLRKGGTPNSNYQALKQGLGEKGILNPTIRQIADVVKSIRRQKLPDPDVLGNAGSFFKNAVVGQSQFLELKQHYVEIPGYAQQDGFVKIPSGWLIEHCGWKGKRHGDVACYNKQALVLVNYGTATGTEILEFSKAISRSVWETFGIRIEPEVNIW